MASAPRVSSSAGSASVATARPASGGRNVATVSTQRVDGLDPSFWAANGDESFLRYDDDFRGRGGGQKNDQRERHADELRFAPLVNTYTVAAAAGETDGGRTGFRAFLADMLRAVGIYEMNMRIISGGKWLAGSAVNRVL